MMFKILPILFFLVYLNSCKSISNSVPVSNSFEDTFKESNIKYKYSDRNQTHDYSGNWDLDGDRKKDQIRFVGNGGVHLQYSLDIQLTGTDSLYSFDWIYTDSPLFEDYSTWGNDSIVALKKFTVFDFTKNGNKDVYVEIGDAINPISEQIKEHGLKSRRVVITFDTITQKLIFLDSIE